MRPLTEPCGGCRRAPHCHGIFSLPFCDWCPLWVYSLSPSAIGAHYHATIDRAMRGVPSRSERANQALPGEQGWYMYELGRTF
eukprot:1195540-Prorocentrum_minimum.AAC.3